MKRLKFILPFVLLLVSIVSCQKEESAVLSKRNKDMEYPILLTMNGKNCCLDVHQKLLRCSAELSNSDFNPLVHFPEYSQVYFNGIKLQNDTINTLGAIEYKRNYQVVVQSLNTSDTFLLSFTNLPIVELSVPSKIYNEPKVLSKLFVHYPSSSNVSDTAYTGIEYRGATVLKYAKKSFGIDIKAPSNTYETESKSLLQKAPKTNWTLDAMFKDEARLRNKTSFEIWNMLNKETDPDIEFQFVEVFINQKYKGLYSMGNKIDAELLQLQNTTDHLYKTANSDRGSTLFSEYTSKPTKRYKWDGWEQRYPDPAQIIDWHPLDSLRQLTVNSSEEQFKSSISNHLDYRSFIDYYILINLLYATDNVAKNNYLYTKGNKQIAIIPWDMDGALGRHWSGIPNNTLESTPILSNNLFQRLINTNANDFKVKLIERWNTLRTSQLSNATLEKLIQSNFQELNISDIIDHESQLWNTDLNLASEEIYLQSWLKQRVEYLDTYYNNL